MPEATHYNLLLYQNQKYQVQQCNNATLSLSKVGEQSSFKSEERRELYLYLCLCGVVWPQVGLIFGSFVMGLHKWVGGVNTVITPVI